MSILDQTVFDRIKTGWDVERCVLDTLKLWSNTYISELERQNGMEAGALARVKGWTLAPSFDKWPEDQLPGVLVICTGLVPPPERKGDGVHLARWNVEVGVCCSARTQQQSHEQAMLYLAAHRAIVLQQSSLGGNVLATTWLDESYDVLDYDDVRSLYAGTATFMVEIDNVTNTYAGPAHPDVPYADWTLPWPVDVEVETHDVTVENVPTNTDIKSEGGTQDE